MESSAGSAKTHPSTGRMMTGTHTTARMVAAISQVARMDRPAVYPQPPARMSQEIGGRVGERRVTLRGLMDSITLDDDTWLLVLTGAGVSAESGIPTFRDANGLWESHRVEDVAS